jgi:plastocyanin
MTRVLTLLLTLVVLVFVAGCGGDDSDSSSGGGGGGGGGQADKPAAPSGGSKAPAGKADVTVAMKDIKFMPANVTVKKGGTVAWVNKDSVPHNVTKDDGPGADFASDTVSPGGDYSQKFDTAGKVAYVCTIHPNQTGSVTVK